MKARNIVALIVLLLVGHFGYRYYQYRIDPLVAGIPPILNADGSIDYTLIGRKSTGPKANDLELTEWVLRFPREFQVVILGDGDVELLNSSGSTPLFKFQKNQQLSTTVSTPDFKPVVVINKSFAETSHNTADIYIVANDMQREWDYWKKSIDSGCIATGKKYGAIIEYIGDAKSDVHCTWDDAKHKILYVLNGADGLQAIFDCQKESNICHYQSRYKKRHIFGSIGLNQIDHFEAFNSFLHNFLHQVTVIDHITNSAELREKNKLNYLHSK